LQVWGSSVCKSDHTEEPPADAGGSSVPAKPAAQASPVRRTGRVRGVAGSACSGFLLGGRGSAGGTRLPAFGGCGVGRLLLAVPASASPLRSR